MKSFYIIFLLSCISLSAVKAEHVKVGLPVEIKEIDPFDLSLLEESEVFASVYEPLISYNVLTGFESGIAERWEFDSAKKTIIFHLKSGITFSDNTPLTAKDVEYTLKRLILLDKDEGLTLTKCLSSNSIKYNDISKNHPLIQSRDDGAIVIGPTNCGEQFLKELGDPVYGVVSRKFVGKDLKIQPAAPVSGAFIYKSNRSGFSLIPNTKNWRWKKAINKNIILDFIKIDQDFSSVKGNSLDMYRTSNREMLIDSKKNGYNLVISIPIMVWFITTDNENLKSALPVLNFLNSDIGKRNFSVFLKNPLEISANSFFSSEFKCQPFSGKYVFKDLKYKKEVIRLINHKSLESEIYIKDIKKELEDNGHTVLVDDQKHNTAGKVVSLYLRRQFFGDGALGTLNYAFRTVRTIPDPKRKIIKKLEQLFQDKMKSTEKDILFKNTCEDLQFYNHVPLAHRKYAFLYKNEKFKELFSKGNGTINYNKIIK
jgi:hypothetical protein